MERANILHDALFSIMAIDGRSVNIGLKLDTDCNIVRLRRLTVCSLARYLWSLAKTTFVWFERSLISQVIKKYCVGGRSLR